MSVLIPDFSVSKMGSRASQRAKLLYDCIDRHDLYVGYAEPGSRSKMNVTFHLKDDSLTSKLVEQSAKMGISGIAGYRSLGGLRVSIYNAVPLAWVEKLVEFLDQFAISNK